MSALAPQGGPPPGVPPQIQVGGAPAGPSDGPDSSNVEKLLMIAKAALTQAEQGEQDHVDSATILKAIQLVQGILAARQQGAESALGVTPAHKAMSRQYGSQ